MEWLIGEAVAGVMFLGVCAIRRRLSYWPIIVLFLLGDGVRAFGDWSGGISPGVWAGAYSGSLPLPIGIVLFVVYASFAAVPMAILIWSSQINGRAAAVTVLVDGVIHLVLPFQPPWMVGASTRWGATHRLVGSTLAKDANPVAAFPSLHVALPASQTGRFRLWAIALSVAVVMLGEHWVIDAAAGWALAFASRWFVQRYWRVTEEALAAEEVVDLRSVQEAETAAA